MKVGITRILKGHWEDTTVFNPPRVTASINTTERNR